MELEALEAILMDEFCGPLTGPRPAGWPPAEEAPAYRVLITPTSGGDAGEAAADHASEWQNKGCRGERQGGRLARAPADAAAPSPLSPSPEQLDLAFAYPPTYPDTAPLVKPRSVRGLSDADLAEVGAAIEAQIEAGSGMPVMYAVVAAAQDWLREKVAPGVGAVSAATAPAEKSKEVLQEEEEARAAAARALGTPVTPATFAAWASTFYAEAKGGGPATPAGGEERATGRQWFERRGAGDAGDDGSDAAYPSDPDEEGEEDLDEGDDDDSEFDLDELEGALTDAAAR